MDGMDVCGLTHTVGRLAWDPIRLIRGATQNGCQNDMTVLLGIDAIYFV